MRHLLALLGALLLSSCFDVREEIWIHRDGSGRIDFSYVVPPHALTLAGGEEELRQSVEAMTAETEGIRVEKFTITPTDRGTRIDIQASIDSLTSLLDLKDSETMASMPPIGEKLMGIPGMILAPVILHFVKVEVSRSKLTPQTPPAF